jgi:hypothetical protein
MCSHSEGEWARLKDCGAFERGMVVGARRIGLSVSRTATLLFFPRSTVSLCIKHDPPTKGHTVQPT